MLFSLSWLDLADDGCAGLPLVVKPDFYRDGAGQDYLDPRTEAHQAGLLAAGDGLAGLDEALDAAGGDADDHLHDDVGPAPPEDERRRFVARAGPGRGGGQGIARVGG